MKLKLIFFITYCFLLIPFVISASVNYTDNLVIKSEPSTPKNKRLRLTDDSSDQAWKGVEGKNILKINLGEGEDKKYNTVSFRVKDDIMFTKIKLKAGSSTDNQEVLYQDTNISGLANDWVTLKVPKTESQYIDLVLKGDRPKIYELKIYHTKSDFNGDGYDDFIVGAAFHDAGGESGTDRGRVYIYLGGTLPLSSTPVLTLSGDESYARFGLRVSGIGDVNKDGYDDFIVAAPVHDAGAGSNVDRGQAYVYLGGTLPLSSTPVLTLSGDEDYANFGESVSGIGDVNNDGYDDFMVGASLDDAEGGPGSARGQAYVYLGGELPLSSTPILTLSGDADSTALGNAVSGIGDVNNDGYDDFIVAAFEHDIGAASNANYGQAYVYLGGELPLSSTPILTLSGDEVLAKFGYSVSGIGDVNKDGYDDFIVGAFGHDVGFSVGANRGRAYVYLGGELPLSSTPALTLSGDENYAYLGSAVSGIGDINKDGYADFMVGADLHNAGGGGGADRGQAYLYLGGTSLSSTPFLTLSGDEDSAFFGNPIRGIGDVNKDGSDDFIIGASSHDAGAGSDADRGQAYVYLGGNGTSLSGTPVLTLSGDQNGASFGGAVD